MRDSRVSPLQNPNYNLPQKNSEKKRHQIPDGITFKENDRNQNSNSAGNKRDNQNKSNKNSNQHKNSANKNVQNTQTNQNKNKETCKRVIVLADNIKILQVGISRKR